VDQDDEAMDQDDEAVDQDDEAVGLSSPCFRATLVWVWP
jgi:hypothetical protein